MDGDKLFSVLNKQPQPFVSQIILKIILNSKYPRVVFLWLVPVNSHQFQS